jgi:hypothetical protein
MSAPSRHTTRITATLLAVLAWVAVSATTALAQVGPNDPGVPTQPRTVTVTTVDFGQLAVTAAAACALGIAVTLVVQLVLRHSRHAAPAQA